MMNLSSEEKSLPQKISEDIIALILEENLQPGDKLPNETILSERLNAGRSSVREAMKLLASRNIVTVRQGSGTYIAASPGMVEDPLGFLFIGDKEIKFNEILAYYKNNKSFWEKANINQYLLDEDFRLQFPEISFQFLKHLFFYLTFLF